MHSRLRAHCLLENGCVRPSSTQTCRALLQALAQRLPTRRGFATLPCARSPPNRFAVRRRPERTRATRRIRIRRRDTAWASRRRYCAGAAYRAAALHATRSWRSDAANERRQYLLGVGAFDEQFVIEAEAMAQHERSDAAHVVGHDEV